MDKRKRILITGTGRAGTSFLIELFTNLGFETGFKPEEIKDYKFSIGRAGF